MVPDLCHWLISSQIKVSTSLTSHLSGQLFWLKNLCSWEAEDGYPMPQRSNGRRHSKTVHSLNRRCLAEQRTRSQCETRIEVLPNMLLYFLHTDEDLSSRFCAGITSPSIMTCDSSYIWPTFLASYKPLWPVDVNSDLLSMSSLLKLLLFAGLSRAVAKV